METTEKDCAFQYAKMNGSSIKIVCDETSLTLEEAKDLWNKYFLDAAKHINSGGTVEMVIWINMVTPQSYQDVLEYIYTDAESDGTNIWVTKKEKFTCKF